MIGTGAAILGAGLIGAGATMWGANKAADAQSRAAQEAAGLQRETMARNQQNAQPFITGGQGASNLLQSFYGIGGGDGALGQSALERFYQSPDYKFTRSEGLSALDNSAAAKGGLLSGNQLRAVTEYGSGLATQNLTNYLTRLSGMAGQGIQAAGSVARSNTTGAAYAGNAMMGAGTAEASGYLGTVKGINSGLSSFMQANPTNNSSYGGLSPLENFGARFQSNPYGSMPKIGGGW